ncbi:MAG: hypothetical protein QNJ17_15740 [Desulfocapsaceae bacterium]|nr:hypothetical protein [Desulfocapsaceae bacterium]
MKSNKGNIPKDKQKQGGRGQCRQPDFGQGLKAFDEEGGWGRSGKTGICRNKRTGIAPAQPVIETSRTSGSVNLQLLKEQAERLTSALEEIQRQIKMFEHH